MKIEQNKEYNITLLALDRNVIVFDTICTVITIKNARYSSISLARVWKPEKRNFQKLINE